MGAPKKIKLNFSIRSSDAKLVNRLFGGRGSVRPGRLITIPGRAQLQYVGPRSPGGFHLIAQAPKTAPPKKPRPYGRISRFYVHWTEPELIRATLMFAQGVVSGVVANWLYNKLKSKKGQKASKLTIGRRTIEIEKHTIIRIIDETLRK